MIVTNAWNVHKYTYIVVASCTQITVYIRYVMVVIIGCSYLAKPNSLPSEYPQVLRNHFKVNM